MNNQQVNKLIDSVDERNEEIESPREMKNINLNQNFAETISENVRIINKIKQPHDQNLILQQLKNHFVFYNLSEAELENIVNKMFYCEVQKDDIIFNLGDSACSFFVIEKGSLEVLVNGKQKRELKAYDGFGELALLYNAPRSATVKALEHSTLWGIDRDTFRKAVEEMITKEYEENRKFMEVVRFFHDLTNEQKDAIAAVLISQKYFKNQNIVLEGDPASSFFIIKRGSAQVLKGSKEVRKLNKGDSFGEQALYYNTVRQMTVKAENEVECLVLGRDTLTHVLGDQVQVVTFRNLQKWAFEKNTNFAKLSKAQLEKVLDIMKITNYKAGDIIFKKGTSANQKIIVLIEGQLKKAKNGFIMASKGAAWGDEFQLETNKSKSLDDDIVMETDGVLAEVSAENFQEAIGGRFEDVLKKNQKSHEHQLQKNENLVKKKEAQTIKLEQLQLIKKIGDGQFGPVYLIRAMVNNQCYVVRSYSKHMVVSQNVEKHLEQERQVMEEVNFPFIVQYHRAYSDQQDLHFLMEYVRGVELFEVIRDIGLLNTYDSQFYVASIIIILEYLHTHNVIYRDVKPENFMVDSQGHLKLIDLGSSKVLKGKNDIGNRTYTIIGTPHYMAPEIIIGKGYNFLADLWSVGICLYEFMCGTVPFGEDQVDPYDIYEEIIKQSLTYPNYLKDKKAKKLITQLLDKVPEIRLGESYDALKAHAWFENFDWHKLIEKELKAPFIPSQDKYLSDQEIKEYDARNILVKDEIQKEQSQRTEQYDKDQAYDNKNWDKNFN